MSRQSSRFSLAAAAGRLHCCSSPAAGLCNAVDPDLFPLEPRAGDGPTTFVRTTERPGLRRGFLHRNPRSLRTRRAHGWVRHTSDGTRYCTWARCARPASRRAFSVIGSLPPRWGCPERTVLPAARRSVSFTGRYQGGRISPSRAPGGRGPAARRTVQFEYGIEDTDATVEVPARRFRPLRARARRGQRLSGRRSRFGPQDVPPITLGRVGYCPGTGLVKLEQAPGPIRAADVCGNTTLELRSRAERSAAG